MNHIGIDEVDSAVPLFTQHRSRCSSANDDNGHYHGDSEREFNKLVNKRPLTAPSHLKRASDEMNKALFNMSDQLEKKLNVQSRSNCDVCRELKSILCFSKRSLPNCYQHDEMYNLIKRWGDLIVMIQVQSTNMNMITQGNGRVYTVSAQKRRACLCNDCQRSKAPKMEWYEIRVRTIASLIKSKDDRVKCTLSYVDNGSGKDVQKSMYSYGVITGENDACYLLCATCDIALAQQLAAVVSHYEECWERAFDKYVDSVKCEEEKLFVIVGHKHGLAEKLVYMGKWHRDSEAQQISYKLPNCPGFLGAPLLVPDFDREDFDTEKM